MTLVLVALEKSIKTATCLLIRSQPLLNTLRVANENSKQRCSAPQRKALRFLVGQRLSLKFLPNRRPLKNLNFERRQKIFGKQFTRPLFLSIFLPKNLNSEKDIFPN